MNDELLIAAGANVFDGESGYENREFGMLRNDDNVFARIRYSFQGRLFHPAHGRRVNGAC